MTNEFDAALAEWKPRLTPTEGKILACLCNHAGEVVPRETICIEVYGYEFDRVRDDALGRGHMVSLRRKLGPAATINTFRFRGYQLLKLESAFAAVRA